MDIQKDLFAVAKISQDILLSFLALSDFFLHYELIQGLSFQQGWTFVVDRKDKFVVTLWGAENMVLLYRG